MDRTRRVSGTPIGVIGCVVISAMLFRGQMHAQTDSVDSGAPVTIAGFVDTYISWNFNRPASHKNQLTNFDLSENQITLAAAEVDVYKAPAPVGFRIEIAGGATPNMVNGDVTETTQLFQQAYLTAVVPVGAGLTVDVGKFYTHMGYEVVKARENFNYSRSYLFAWPIPYYHTGIRASYPLFDNLAVTAHLSNGWNNVIANSGKTFGTSIAYAPTSSVSLIANWIGGPEEADSVSNNLRHVVEGIISLHATENMTLAVDIVYGTEKLSDATAIWKGAAAYARYAFTQNSAISLRGELYSDPTGFTTGLVQDLSEITLTFEQRVAGNFILRAEYRYDTSTATPFDGSDGDATKKSQNRLGLACIVAF